MQLEQERHRFPGPNIVIDCPACKAAGANATTYDEEIRESAVGGLVPLKTTRGSWVMCSKCGVILRSRRPVAELEGMSPAELAPLVFREANFYQKSLAVGALVLAIVPCVGTTAACISLLANLKFSGWTKKVSYAALGLSFVPIVFGAILFILDAMGILK